MMRDDEMRTMQSSDGGKTWVPAVPVSAREVGAFSLRYLIIMRVRAFFRRILP